MEDLPIGSEIILKVVESETEECNGCFFDEISRIFMKISAKIFVVPQSTEKTERMFNSKE